MKVLLFILIITSLLSPVDAVSIELSASDAKVSGKDFSYYLKESLLYFKSDYFSYGRLDSFSLYNTLFNPYRVSYSSTLSAKESSQRGLRGVNLTYGPLSAAFSFEDAYSLAFAYDGKYVDAALMYYDDKEEEKDSIIRDFRHSSKKAVHSFLLRGGYKNYVDLMGIFSYSPDLGIDFFYMGSFSYSIFKLSVKGGNTLLSSNAKTLRLDLNIRSTYLDFDYYLEFGSASLYTDLFRTYSSSYSYSLKYNGAKFTNSASYTFTENAERKRENRYSLSYRGINIGYDSENRVYLSIQRGRMKLGSNSGGQFFTFDISDNLSISFINGKLDFTIRLVF